MLPGGRLHLGALARYSLFEITAVGIGVFSIYVIGIPWLKVATQMPWPKAFAVGMIPFLIGDAVKASAALLLARAVRPILSRQLQSLSL